MYVSFYKGIGALPGCCVAGPDDVIAELREWRQRMGGTLYGMWPGAASALTCLARRRPLMPAYLRHARAIAAELGGLPGVRVLPDPPQVPMMHLLLATSQDGFAAAAARLAAQERHLDLAEGDADRRPRHAAGRAVGRRRHLRAVCPPRSATSSRRWPSLA